MGVEPTAACSAQPATSFEDWGTHQGTTTPKIKCTAIRLNWHSFLGEQLGQGFALSGQDRQETLVLFAEAGR
jgi:hypothetical protein